MCTVKWVGLEVSGAMKFFDLERATRTSDNVHVEWRKAYAIIATGNDLTAPLCTLHSSLTKNEKFPVVVNVSRHLTSNCASKSSDP